MTKKDWRPVYPGSLGEWGRQITLSAAFEGGVDDWIIRTEGRLLAQLLGYYGIALDDPHKWFRLALSLARDNVPAFRIRPMRRRGRPRKSIHATGLTKPAKASRPDSRRNRSKLLWAVRVTQEAHGLSGHGRDKAALEILLREVAREKGQSEARYLADNLKWFQRRLSEARKENPESDEK
ncbi:hypothetical protein [Burkholderia cepacia]|uniref:hypothetical protein n=1 Tax=Burkholderia cepacia TaxID=292 RepID=UPI0012D86710|nr:hypothetical protein [Burkholderia cepacia]